MRIIAPYTTDEIKAITSKMEVRERAMFLFACDTGLDCEQILDLKISDFENDKGLIKNIIAIKYKHCWQRKGYVKKFKMDTRKKIYLFERLNELKENGYRRKGYPKVCNDRYYFFGGSLEIPMAESVILSYIRRAGREAGLKSTNDFERTTYTYIVNNYDKTVIPKI